MKKVVIFGTSLNPESRSQILAREVKRRLDAQSVANVLIDLRDLRLPESGRPGAYDHESVRQIRREVSDATHVVFAAAVYNFDLSSAAKNLMELMDGDEMQDKIVGFVCAAGGKSSYMSVMSFANSLMLDFRSWIVPRYVYAVKADFKDGQVVNEEITKRLDAFVTEFLAGPKGYRE